MSVSENLLYLMFAGPGGRAFSAGKGFVDRCLMDNTLDNGSTHCTRLLVKAYEKSAEACEELSIGKEVEEKFRLAPFLYETSDSQRTKDFLKSLGENLSLIEDTERRILFGEMLFHTMTVEGINQAHSTQHNDFSVTSDSLIVDCLRFLSLDIPLDQVKIMNEKAQIRPRDNFRWSPFVIKYFGEEDWRFWEGNETIHPLLHVSLRVKAFEEDLEELSLDSLAAIYGVAI